METNEIRETLRQMLLLLGGHGVPVGAGGSGMRACQCGHDPVDHHGIDPVVGCTRRGCDCDHTCTEAQGWADVGDLHEIDWNDGIADLRPRTGNVGPDNREGVGTGADEGATGQDTGTAWVTRSTDCPEAPAQAHPLAAELVCINPRDTSARRPCACGIALTGVETEHGSERAVIAHAAYPDECRVLPSDASLSDGECETCPTCGTLAAARADPDRGEAVVAVRNCVTCSGRGVWMDEPCGDCARRNA